MENHTGKILLAVNNELLKKSLEEIFAAGNYFVTHCDRNKRKQEVLNDIAVLRPDLILLEGSSADVDVLDQCHAIKNHPLLSDVKIIVLSDWEEEYVEIAAFNAGTNDYIIKPLRKPGALLSRIKALLKKESNATIVQKHGKKTIRIDQESLSVYIDDELVKVTKKEFELLLLLSSRPGKLFKRKEIYQHVWNSDDTTTRTVDVHIRHLRSKLGKDFISTQKGVGYRFLTL